MIMKFWIFLALVSVALGASKEQADDYAFPDYWQNDYEWYSDEAEKLGIISSVEKNVSENDDNEGHILNEKGSDVPIPNAAGEKSDSAEPTSVAVEESKTEEIKFNEENIQQETDNQRKSDDEEGKDPFDLFGDYQFEDNRSDPDNEQLDIADNAVVKQTVEETEAESDESSDESRILEDTADDENNENIFDETRDILDNDKEENLNPIGNADNVGIFDDTQDILNNDKTEEAADYPIFEKTYNKKILDETRNILAEDEETAMLAPPDDTDDQSIFDETRAILDEDDLDDVDNTNNLKIGNEAGKEAVKDDVPYDEVPQKILEGVPEESDEAEEDETLTNDKKSKGNDDISVAREDEQKVDEIDKNNNLEEQANEGDMTDLKESDAKQDTKDDDDTVHGVIQDLNDDLTQLFETLGKLTNNDGENDDNVSSDDDVLKYEEKYGKPFREEFVLSQRDDYENIDDDHLDEIFANMFNVNKNRVTVDGVDESDKSKKEKEQIFFANDALDSDDYNKKENDNTDPAPVIEELDELKKHEPEDTEKEIKTIPVEDLTPSQYEDLMKQFAAVHSADLDTNSEDFGRNIAPIPITLSVDEPEIIESPNYPGNYPTNSIVDWIIDGDGMGIELNITDFTVNGAAGDYLLIIPGGVDASRKDGLLFSYTLNEQRNFRFMDVDRMYVRFYTGQALIGMRGFQFSAKMVAPVEEESDLDLEPAPLLPLPAKTLTLNLGGLTLEEFVLIKEQFRQLIARMATMYINAKSIEMGLNTTDEITQITRADLCNVDWPNATYCAEVTFGVPLVYQGGGEPKLTDEELSEMWSTYNDQNPFAFELRRLGITEFSVPNDSTVLMMWVVVAVGVLVTMSLLAFALWRCNCFEDYTRMAAYSDTDSVKGKRDLDLFPTPHQTLPPLFADAEDYKWDDDVKYDDSTRVDMGGFANRSYVRDELFDIDSDEDIITPQRDRTSFSPRDIYQV